MLEKTSSVETEKINSTNSSGEFDLDQFKYGMSISMKHGKGQIVTGIKQLKEDDIAANYQGSLALDGEEQQKYIYFLGIKFPLEAIQERNQNPKHVLIPLYLCLFLGFGGYFIIFTFGTNFDLVSSILNIFSTLFASIGVTFFQKQLIKDAFNLKKNGLALFPTVIAINLFTALVLYSFLKKTPFENIAYFLVAFYPALFVIQIGGAILTMPNTDNFNDPNYQYKYYYKRVIMGILNSTGIVDAVSDIALGAQIFLDYNNYIKYLGLFLFILCSMDLFIVNVRMIWPSKVGVRMHISAIILEIFIIIISILAALKMKKEQLSTEFIGLLIVSFFTTGVNFLHHIFVVVDWQLDIRQSNRVITLGEVFK